MQLMRLKRLLSIIALGAALAAGGTTAGAAEGDGTPAAQSAGAAPKLELHRDLGELLRDEKPSGLARAELASGQTLHGAILGIELCVIAECKDARAWVALPMVGAGLGLTGSLLLLPEGVTP